MDTIEQLNQNSKNTLMETLDIVYTHFTGDTLTACMPITPRVHQPYGLLHGGASAVIAETVGSYLSALQLDRKKEGAVGTNINVYHLKSIRKGLVYATASFIRKGKSLHVVKIEVKDDDANLISHAILTNKIIPIQQTQND